MNRIRSSATSAAVLATLVATLATALAPAPAGASVPLAGDPTPGVLNAVDSANAKDVWAVGYAQSEGTTTTPLAEHWNGTSWTVTPTAAAAGRPNGLFLGTAVVSADDVWAVGSANSQPDVDNRTLAEHWNGKKWKVVSTPEPEGVALSYLQSVTAVSTDDVWAVGYFYGGDGGSIIEHWDGTAWSLVTGADPTGAYNANLQSVSALSSKNVWAAGFFYDTSGAGTTLVEHWNGRKWKRSPSQDVPGSPDTEIRSITATAPDDVWATGFFWDGAAYQPLTEHWDGSAWTIVDAARPAGASNTYLYAVDGTSADDVWATGYFFANGRYATLAEHWDGETWSIVATPNITGGSNSLLGVHAITPKNVWTTGYAYTNADVALIEHWNGRKWSLVKAG